MFSLDHEVKVHHQDGQIHKYTLLENQGDRHLVVLNPAVVAEMNAYLSRGGNQDDGLVALLIDEAVVIDRKRGTPLALGAANQVLAESGYAILRRAAMFREPLPERTLPLTCEDLAWSFGLELAKRRLDP
jgi:hypothetical protein